MRTAHAFNQNDWNEFRVALAMHETGVSEASGYAGDLSAPNGSISQTNQFEYTKNAESNQHQSGIINAIRLIVLTR